MDGYPSRILCVCEDGSVRLLNSLNGLILMTAFPVFKDTTNIDTVYDGLNNRIYSLLSNGETVIYKTNTNPCVVEQVWCPYNLRARDKVLCMAGIYVNQSNIDEQDTTICNNDTINSDVFWLVGGTDNGQLVTLDLIDNGKEHIIIQAHAAVITCINTIPQSQRIASAGEGQ